MSFFLDLSLFGLSLKELILELLHLGIDLSDLILDNLKLFHLLGSECLSSIRRLFQWLHLQEDGVVVNNVNDVRAEEGSGLRLLLHVLNCEEWLCHHWLESILLPFGNAITVECLHLINKLLRVVHHLLSLTPGIVLLLILDQNEASLSDLDTILGW